MSSSDYFSAMFSHNMLERERPVVELLDLPPTGFTQLLDYFYHGHITLQPDCVEDVLEVARFFQVLTYIILISLMVFDHV